MRWGRVAIRLIAVLGMLAILMSPATSTSAAEAVLPKPEIKVTPQAGPNKVIFLVTGVGFAAPAVTGPLFLQVQYLATGQYIKFNDASLTTSSDGVIVTSLTFSSTLPNGDFQARVASAETGGTVYASASMKIDSSLPVTPAISITPNSGPVGDPNKEGTLFILAGTSLTPREIYYLGIVSVDGYTFVNFSDPLVDADDDGIVLTTLSFNKNLAIGDYNAGLFTIDRATNKVDKLVAATRFTLTAPPAPPIKTKPEIKVTPQAGATTMRFLLTGVGFGPPNVSGRIYFQVQSRANEKYLEFENPVVSPTSDGLVVGSISFDGSLPNGTYLAKVASAPTGGTVFASYEFRVDSTLPVKPAISITPSFGPAGDPTAGGTTFLLAGTGLTPNAVYTLEVASADGRTTLEFDDPTVQADGGIKRTENGPVEPNSGALVQALSFDAGLPTGAYVARLRSAAGAVVAETSFGIGTSAPSPQPSGTPTIPSPPPTGNGGALPGLPNTGGGGAATTAPASPDLGLAVGGLAIVICVAVGSALRRRRAA